MSQTCEKQGLQPTCTELHCERQDSRINRCARSIHGVALWSSISNSRKGPRNRRAVLCSIEPPRGNRRDQINRTSHFAGLDDERGNDVCIPREKFIGGFKSRGEASPDIKWEIKEILVAGDRVIVRGEASGTPSGIFRGIPASGKSFKIMSIDIHTIEDGKIKRSYHVEDWAGAMRQVSSSN